MQPPTGDSDSNLVVSESKSERQVTFIISGLGTRGQSFFLQIHVSLNQKITVLDAMDGGSGGDE